MMQQVFALLTVERLSVALVYLMGSTVGAFAARGMTPMQWGGAMMAVLGSILVAVLVHTAPEKDKAKAKAPAR